MRDISMKSVAVIGANLKGNIGDFALLHAALVDLRRVFPDHAVDVYTHGFHSIDEQRLAAFRVATGLPFRIAGKTFHAKPPGGLHIKAARAVGLWPAIQDHEIRSLANRMSAQAEVFSGYDAVVIVGGAHWNKIKVGISMFGTLHAVHRHNQKIYAYPFSLDAAVSNYNFKSALRRYFDMIGRPLLTRDGISKQVLDALGIPATLTADTVFSLADEAEDIAPKAGLDGKGVILSVTRAEQDDIVAAATRFDRNATPICLMTTCWTEDERYFAPAAARLGVPYLAPDTWQDAVAELKASALLITNRLHGIIFAALAGTPVLVVTNRQKTKAFAADAGLPMSIGSIAAVTPDIVAECLSRRVEILDAMQRYLAAARRKTVSPFPVVAH
jgi:polysaccharide pyruvyl transferase WcaK-like protein